MKTFPLPTRFTDKHPHGVAPPKAAISHHGPPPSRFPSRHPESSGKSSATRESLSEISRFEHRTPRSFVSSPPFANSLNGKDARCRHNYALRTHSNCTKLNISLAICIDFELIKNIGPPGQPRRGQRVRTIIEPTPRTDQLTHTLESPTPSAPSSSPAAASSAASQIGASSPYPNP